jgi:preprotein translocase subunit Sec63
MSWVRVVAVVLGLLVYLRSPIDLIPDRLGPIGLVDDLIVLLIVAWWLRHRFRAAAAAHRSDAEQPAPAASAMAWDPYVVLGVRPGASSEEITQAYRQQMKRYHPDRVADLGEELQQVAHRKAVEIQRAYAELAK